jgi:exopolysaccharide biosynthesis polyprenyl glycosylphosphotransferase
LEAKLQKSISLARGESAAAYALPRVAKQTIFSHGSILIAWDGAAAMAVAEVIPMPASGHFRLAVGAALALMTVSFAGAHGGYGELAGLGRRHIERAVGHFLLALLVLRLVAALLDRGLLLSPYWLAADAVSTSALLAGIRLARAPSAKVRPGGTVVILAGEADEREVEAAIAARGIPGRVAGAFCLNGPPGEGSHWPVIQHAHLLAFLRSGGIRHVVFAGRPDTQARQDEIFSDLFREVFGVATRVWLALDVHEVFPGAIHQRAERYRLVPMLGEHTLDARQPLKRCFDMLIGGAALVCLSPLMGLIALALRVSGEREVLFRQERIGAGGRRFVLLKFRTMRTRPDEMFLQATRDDPRVTKLGAVLRRSSLDELPQLINVIRGDMSLVGPRPHAPETTVEGLNFEEAAKFYRLRYRVKPGMTGLAQIRGQRGATGDLGALERRVTSDLEYIQTWSAWLDLMILARTIPAMLRPRNAY